MPLATLTVLIVLAATAYVVTPPSAPPTLNLTPEQMEEALRAADILMLKNNFEHRQQMVKAGLMSQTRADAEENLERVKVREEWLSRMKNQTPNK